MKRKAYEGEMRRLHGELVAMQEWIKDVRGTAENPMTRAEVDEKSYDLMVPVLGKSRARKLCDAVWKLERVRDLRLLRPLLRA